MMDAETLFDNIVVKNFPHEKVLTIIQGKGTVPRNEAGRNIHYDEQYLSNYKLVNKDDYIIHLRSFEGGFELANSNGIVSPAYTILRCKKPHAPIFYDAYFHTNEFINHVLYKAVEGIDGRQISYEAFKWLKIPYCSKSEQDKIARLLQILNNRISKQQKLIECFKSYKRGLFFNLYNSTVKRNTLFKEIYQRAAEGGTPSTTIAEYYVDGKIPFTKIEDLSQRYLFFTKSFITQKGLENSSAWLVPRNSIIFSNGATIGACSINKIEVSTKQGILGIVPRNDYSSEYLYHYFTSSLFRQKVKAITTKGTMDCAYLKDMDYLKIEVPEYKDQIRIAKILNKIEDEIETHVAILKKLKYLKSGLLQALFI